jgi:hypothetical protein
LPSIPLPQFPAEFNARCFKCNSNSLHFNFTKHPWMWTKLEIQYSCRMCGMTGYGEDNVVAKFSPQLESWRREQQRAAWEAQMLREGAQREAEERAAREAQEAATAAARDAQIMAQKNEEYQMRVNEALERRRIQTLENKRRRDKEYRDRKKMKLAMDALSEEMRLAEERTAEVRARREEEERAAAAAATKCAWRDCSEHRTESSKYCSRRCSNRNAAWNLKQRISAASFEADHGH